MRTSFGSTDTYTDSNLRRNVAGGILKIGEKEDETINYKYQRVESMFT